MGKFQIGDKSNYTTVNVDGKLVNIVKKDVFDSFNPDILGLGEIGKKSNQVNAISVMFDLEGFTNFCKQIDPHLAVPEYLSDFLNWIFQEIRKECMKKEYDKGYSTYSSLPFLSKYLGDGLLFLWDAQDMSDSNIRNVVVSMYEVCNKYTTDFLPKISKKVVAAPPRLRCGIARGSVYSVGNGEDYVGPCINMSARLQKFNSLSFCFSRRGINPEEMSKSARETFVVKRVEVRGIGESELVCISKEEYELLGEDDKVKFSDV